MTPRATTPTARALERFAEPAPAPAAAPSLLDAVLSATAAAEPAGRAGGALAAFLAEPAPARALTLWLGRDTLAAGPDLKDRVAEALGRDVARIDELLSRQVNAVLHHPAFQKLEASWRGLCYLVEQVPEGENLKIRVLNATWKELARDQERAIEFDQSQLFQKVYSEEFGTPGGEPFGMLLADYQVHLRPGPEHPIDDLAALAGLSGVAAAAFAPLVAAAHPSMLD